VNGSVPVIQCVAPTAQLNPPPTGEVETNGDIEAAMALTSSTMGSTLCGVKVYYPVFDSATDSDDVAGALALMAADGEVLQFSESWPIVPSAVTAQLFEELAAQGQTFFMASGDWGGYQYNAGFPAFSPNLVAVGGTMLTMTGAGTTYGGEALWSTPNDQFNSGGGILDSIDPITGQYVTTIPSYQNNPVFQTALASLLLPAEPSPGRAYPDVSIVAAEWAFSFGTHKGTSFASPLWAGYMALVNELTLANQLNPVFPNPTIYAIGNSASSSPLLYSSTFTDISSGTAYSYDTGSMMLTPQFNTTAAPGYDMASGWGSPKALLIDTLSCLGCKGTTPVTGNPLVPGACKDLSNDVDNCGACGSACMETDHCYNGQCKPTGPIDLADMVKPLAITADLGNVYWTDTQNAYSVTKTGTCTGSACATWPGPATKVVSLNSASIAVDFQGNVLWAAPDSADAFHVAIYTAPTASPGQAGVSAVPSCVDTSCPWPINYSIPGIAAFPSSDGSSSVFWISGPYVFVPDVNPSPLPGTPTSGQPNTYALWQFNEPKGTFTQVGATFPPVSYTNLYDVLSEELLQPVTNNGAPAQLFWGSPVQTVTVSNGGALLGMPTTLTAPEPSFNSPRSNGLSLFLVDTAAGASVKSVGLNQQGAVPSPLPSMAPCDLLLEIAVDVTDVYALGGLSLDQCTMLQYGLWRIPVNGGAPALLTPLTDTTGQLLLDDDAIYWSEPGNGKVRKLFK
jgi:hypothetical protein